MITQKSGDKEQNKQSAEKYFRFGVQASNDSELEQAALHVYTLRHYDQGIANAERMLAEIRLRDS